MATESLSFVFVFSCSVWKANFHAASSFDFFNKRKSKIISIPLAATFASLAIYIPSLYSILNSKDIIARFNGVLVEMSSTNRIPLDWILSDQ